MTMDATKPDQCGNITLYPTTQKFIDLHENVANQAVQFVQLDEFTEAYKSAFQAFKNKEENARPPLAGSSREADKIRANLHEFILSDVKIEINTVVEEEELDKKFRELDEIKIAYQHLPKTKQAWRPPGDAETHMKPFETATKLKERDALIRQVKAEQEKWNILKSRIETKRKRIIHLNSSIVNNMEKLEIESLRKSKTGSN